MRAGRLSPFALALFALLAGASSDAAGTPELRVILLGTGGPELTPDRSGIATLIIAGDQKLLFDAGRETLQRLYESRIDVATVTRVFLTHLHNDHIEGLPGLWLTPWFLLGRDRPMELWGPTGSAAMIQGMRAMYAFDIQHRSNAFNKAENLEISVHEMTAGPIYSRAGLSVSAFDVWHDDGNPAFGFRIEYRGRSVVLSGDTTFSANVVQAGRGADVIVHNVVAMSEALSKAAEMRPVLAKLTTPEQAAKVFAQAGPRLAVLSHIVKKELPGRAGDDAILSRVRRAGYRGRLEMGHDRMIIDIGESIQVSEGSSLANLPEADRKAIYPQP